MKSDATHYECDSCQKEVTIFHSGRRIQFGPSAIEGWILLANGICYCSLKCFLNDYDQDEIEVALNKGEGDA